MSFKVDSKSVSVDSKAVSQELSDRELERIAAGGNKAGSGSMTKVAGPGGGSFLSARGRVFKG